MANLVYGFQLSSACKQPVGEVEYERVVRTNVLVGVYDARRHRNENRVLLTNTERQALFALTRAILPKMEVEGARHENESVRLVRMLMWASGDTWTGNAEISHHRLEAFGQLVLTKGLDQPST
jgi:hypothetical protein